MELIKKFIQDFIKAEYNCIKTEYDFCFSDKEYELLRKEASIFYHSYLGEQFYRGIEEDEFEEIDDDVDQLHLLHINAGRFLVLL